MSERELIIYSFLATIIVNLILTISIHMGIHILYERIKGAPE